MAALDLLVTILVLPALMFAYFGMLVGLGQVLSHDRLRAVKQSLWPLRLTLWQMMCVVAAAAFLILVFEKQLEVLLAVWTISVVVLAWFVRAWIHEFVFLMGLRDDDLPGRHDKIIWTFLLFLIAPIAIWLFRSYRLLHWPEPVAESNDAAPSVLAGATMTQPAGG